MKKIIASIIKKFYPPKITVEISPKMVERQKEIHTDTIIANIEQIELFPLGSEVVFLQYNGKIQKGKIVGFTLSSHFNEVKFDYMISVNGDCFTHHESEKAVSTSVENLLQKITNNNKSLN